MRRESTCSTYPCNGIENARDEQIRIMAQVFVIVIPATSIERVFLVWKTCFWDVVDVEKIYPC